MLQKGLRVRQCPGTPKRCLQLQTIHQRSKLEQRAALRPNSIREQIQNQAKRDKIKTQQQQKPKNNKGQGAGRTTNNRTYLGRRRTCLHPPRKPMQQTPRYAGCPNQKFAFGGAPAPVPPHPHRTVNAQMAEPLRAVLLYIWPTRNTPTRQESMHQAEVGAYAPRRGESVCIKQRWGVCIKQR